jgi:hypothetical protein
MIGHQISDRRDRSHAVKRAGTRQCIEIGRSLPHRVAATIARLTNDHQVSVSSDGPAVFCC